MYLTRSGTVWSQQAYLKASNSDAIDLFGSSVAISGDTVVVGAYWEASYATGINDDQSDNSAPLAGAAYVFTRSGTVWSQQAYLKASNSDAIDLFGYSVAISGDTLVVALLTGRAVTPPASMAIRVIIQYKVPGRRMYLPAAARYGASRPISRLPIPTL